MPLYDYFNKNELVVLENALEALLEQLPEDDEDTPVAESLLRRFTVWAAQR